jgi:hypothetical protein
MTDDHCKMATLTNDGKEEDDQNPDQLRTDATATRAKKFEDSNQIKNQYNLKRWFLHHLSSLLNSTYETEKSSNAPSNDDAVILNIRRWNRLDDRQQ